MDDGVGGGPTRSGIGRRRMEKIRGAIYCFQCHYCSPTITSLPPNVHDGMDSADHSAIFFLFSGENPN